MKLFQHATWLVLSSVLAAAFQAANDVPTQVPILPTDSPPANHSRAVPTAVFESLEELARIVDISYCIGLPPGSPGIAKPFTCLSRCNQFPNFELVTTFHTGLLLADACGYIALDHVQRRIIVAFRGTYSLMDAIIDLSTIPQEYVPYPDPPRDGDEHGGNSSRSSCTNCTVHAGFFASWQNTRATILPPLQSQIFLYQQYTLHFVGHSLGGAIAALAGLDALTHGWGAPIVTTFGEPRIGNAALASFLAEAFDLQSGDQSPDEARFAGHDGSNSTRPGICHRYRRVTHADDPVPLLPLSEWGYASHAGEIFISRHALPPSTADLEFCSGAADPHCSDSQESSSRRRSVDGPFASPGTRHADATSAIAKVDEDHHGLATRSRLLLDQRVMSEMYEARTEPWGGVPARYRLWELFFAHRDYFWRLGLCVPGGDPLGGGGPYVLRQDTGKSDL